MRMRRQTIRACILALPISAAATGSISAVSSLALDDEPDRRPVGVPASSIWSEPAPVAQVIVPPPAAPAAQRTLSANPLWAMPLTQFSVTRERPIFSPSRRPPAPTIAPATTASFVAPPKPKEPARPQLSLVGTIAGDDEKFGIFVDQSNKAVLRLKVGEEFQGWKLISVQGRDSTLEKDNQVVQLALPQPGSGFVATATAQNQNGVWPAGPDSGKPLPVRSHPRQ